MNIPGVTLHPSSALRPALVDTNLDRSDLPLSPGVSYDAAAAAAAADPNRSYAEIAADALAATFPAAATPGTAAAERPYQADGRKFLAGYLSMPGSEKWRTQFWEAPLGGFPRRLLGDWGMDPGHAAIAERTIAGLVATGIGVPAFMAGINGLSQMGTPSTPDTIPLR